MSKSLSVILNDIRSCYNVGSIMRTAEFFGFSNVYFVGVTPYPTVGDDQRLPHIREKLDKQIKKVSLGAERNLQLEHFETLEDLTCRLRLDGWQIVALEQDHRSIPLTSFKPERDKVALVLGTEVTGLNESDLNLVDKIVEIPRFGFKESLNVSVAFGIAAAVVKQA